MYTEKEKINQYIKTVKNQFEAGAGYRDLDDLATPEIIQEIICYKSVGDGMQKANNAFSDKISLLTEWILQHSDDDGSYKSKATPLSPLFDIKTDKQYRRDVHDGQKRKNGNTRASTIAFSGLSYYDDDGTEVYSFEQCEKMSVSDTYFKNELQENIINELTDEERVVFYYRILKKFTLEQTANATGLKIKQVRNRIDKVKSKIMDIIGDVA